MATRLIKKYKNRRLYDTALSQYITIEELKQYVLQGILFQVEEAADRKDITNATLLQIFVETQMDSAQFLSADILRQLIIMAHHPANSAFQTMMQTILSFGTPPSKQ